MNLHCLSERKPNYYCLNKWTISINAIAPMGFILFQLCLSVLSFCTALKTNSQPFMSVENRGELVDAGVRGFCGILAKEGHSAQSETMALLRLMGTLIAYNTNQLLVQHLLYLKSLTET